MKIYVESEVECTVDGVGLLEPGKPVQVDPGYFRLFHGVDPSKANFPRTVKVYVDVTEAEEAEEVN